MPHVGPNSALGSQPTAPRCLMLAPTLLIAAQKALTYHVGVSRKPVMPLKRSGVGGSCCAGPGRLQLLQAHGCGFGASTVQSWGHVAGFWATGPGFQPLDNLRFSNRTTFGWIFGIKHYQTFMFLGCLILSHLDSPVFQIRRFLKRTVKPMELQGQH